MKDQNPTNMKESQPTDLTFQNEEENDLCFELTRTSDERLLEQMTKAHDEAFKRGLRFCQDPAQGGYQGMDRAANIDIPDYAWSMNQAQWVFEILCGEDSDGPHYQTAMEFWRDQFNQDAAFWMPTKMQILGFYTGVQDYWAAQQEELGPLVP